MPNPFLGFFRLGACPIAWSVLRTSAIGVEVYNVVIKSGTPSPSPRGGEEKSVTPRDTKNKGFLIIENIPLAPANLGTPKAVERPCFPSTRELIYNPVIKSVNQGSLATLSKLRIS
jgi:hypothetical protein